MRVLAVNDGTLAAMVLLIVAARSAAVSCLVNDKDAGGGAKKVTDIEGDNSKDYQFQAASGANQRTFIDEHGSRVELWCQSKREFVRMYIPGPGKPLNNRETGECSSAGKIASLAGGSMTGTARV